VFPRTGTAIAVTMPAVVGLRISSQICLFVKSPQEPFKRGSRGSYELQTPFLALTLVSWRIVVAPSVVVRWTFSLNLSFPLAIVDEFWTIAGVSDGADASSGFPNCVAPSAIFADIFWFGFHPRPIYSRWIPVALPNGTR